MRLRRVKNAMERLEACSRLLINPEKIELKELFNNDNPIHIEIGMGKGKFITTLAKENPDINYIGIEKYDSVMVRAIEKEIPDNLKLVLFDATNIDTLFENNSIDKIYLNFSDPWPKNGYKKRRLTHEVFLKKYEKILKKDGIIQFKTDNRKLFEFSLISMNEYKMRFLNISLDLHKDDIKNIETEYEEKFKAFGPIYFIEVKYEANSN